MARFASLVDLSATPASRRNRSRVRAADADFCGDATIARIKTNRAGDCDNREVAASAANLCKPESGCGRRNRKTNFRQDFVGLDRGSHRTGKKFARTRSSALHGSNARRVSRRAESRAAAILPQDRRGRVIRRSCRGCESRDARSPPRPARVSEVPRGFLARSRACDGASARRFLISPRSIVMKESSAIRLISMSAEGVVTRRFSIGIRLCPPARSFAPGSSASIRIASSSVFGHAYVKRGGFSEILRTRASNKINYRHTVNSDSGADRNIVHSGRLARCAESR